MKSVTLAQWREEVLALYEPPLRAPLTFAAMRTMLGHMETIGVETTADLKPVVVARYIKLLEANGCNGNTIRGRLAYLSAACSYALFAGYLESSPFKFRGPAAWVRKVPKLRTKPHSIDTIAKVLTHLRDNAGTWKGGRLYTLACLYAYCGLRRNEALRLKVEDVDLVARIVTIDARTRLKTEASAAPVPIPPALAIVLEDWIGRVGSEWLIPGNKLRGPWLGGMLGDRAGEHLKRAAMGIGVNGFTPLSLRHSLATHAEIFGLSAMMLRRVLRHSTEFTSGHYRHADLTNMSRAVDAIDFGVQTPKREEEDNAKSA